MPIPESRSAIVEASISGLSNLDENPEVLVRLTDLLIEENRIAEAEQTFEKIIWTKIKPIDRLWLQCRFYAAKNNTIEGIKAGEELLFMGVEFYNLHLTMTDLYLKVGDYKKALQQVQHAILSNPYKPDSYTLQSKIFLHLNDTTSALASYKQAIEFCSFDLSLTEKYIGLLMQKGMIEETNEVVERYQKSHPGNPSLTYLAAQMKFMQNDFVATDSILRSMTQLNMVEQEFLQLRGNVKIELTQFDSAVYFADKILEIKPLKEAYQLKGKALDKRYKYQEALNSYYMALRLDTADSYTKQEIGILHRKIAYLRKIQEDEQRRKKVIEPLMPVRRKF